MKTLVITDQRGEIAGLARYEDEQVEGGPDKIELEPLEGQRVHEIELPRELEGIDSVIDLYKAFEADYTVDPDSGKLTRNKGDASA
jgi:hypothetical protein